LIDHARTPSIGLGVSKKSESVTESKTATEQLRIAAEVLRWEATCIERLTGKLEPVFPQLSAAPGRRPFICILPRDSTVTLASQRAAT
jgi:hypothetical protein